MIGTFEITRQKNLWIVQDTDAFNNWGVRHFSEEAQARSWAEWAHKFKTGRTFGEWSGE